MFQKFQLRCTALILYGDTSIYLLVLELTVNWVVSCRYYQFFSAFCVGKSSMEVGKSAIDSGKYGVESNNVTLTKSGHDARKFNIT